MYVLLQALFQGRLADADSQVLPNDQPEQDRLDILHDIERVLMNYTPTLAPLHNPRRILDIGSGTGAWAYDMADAFPTATVTGLDLTPPSPKHWHPSCRFEVDDAEDSWSGTYPTDHDLVHVRYMLGSIVSWPRLLRQAFDHTSPGGWIEIIETPIGIYSSSIVPPAIASYFNNLNRVFVILNRDIQPDMEQIQCMLEEAGWTDVQMRVDRLPIGTGGNLTGDRKMEAIGALTRKAHIHAFDSYGMAVFTRALGWSLADSQDLFKSCREQFMVAEDMWLERWHFLGKKPETAECDGLSGMVHGMKID